MNKELRHSARLLVAANRGIALHNCTSTELRANYSTLTRLMPMQPPAWAATSPVTIPSKGLLLSSQP
eukprot:3663143-Amphidinium_carterae.1